MEISIKIKIILTTIFLVVVTSAIIGVSIDRLASESLTLSTADAQELRKETFAIISVSLLVSMIITVIYSLKLIGPVDELIIGTQLVAQGRLDHKIRRKSNDEIGRLVDSFNRMIVNLKKSQEQSTQFSDMAEVEKQKAELIIDSMADGVIVTDSLHKIVLFNPSAEKLFDMDGNKAIGKHIVNILKQFKLEKLFEDFPEIKDYLLPIRKSNIKIREFEIQKPKPRVLKASMAPLKNQNNMVIGTVIVFEDITKMKELDKMKIEFVSTVSHELRTPLTSIKGYAALLADERLGLLNEKQLKSVKIINKESDRLAYLINDILDLSKLESGNAKTNFEMADIRQCLEECPILSVAKNKGIKVNQIIPRELPLIRIDRAKIIQVFNNLLSNSIKFTKPEGRINIKISNTKDYVIVEISDTGVGIPKKDIPNLFNRFYQVESHLTRNQGGTGLGLTIVKEIVGLHHGLISVSSTIHKGTSVSFALPKKKLSQKDQTKCWEERTCKKVKCPAYQTGDKRCWLYVGTFCKKSSNEPCIDKIGVCGYCDIYKRGLEQDDKD